MRTILDNLKEYFETTSPEQIKKDWDAAAKYDQVNSPTVDEFLNDQRNIKFLWLDDIRNPFTPSYINQYPQLVRFHQLKKLYKVEIIWVRNYLEMQEWIIQNGLPDYISFDHDLADEHYTPPRYWSDYQASKEYQDQQDYKEKTGLDCAKYITEYCMDYNRPLPKYFCHSANPVGSDNILSYLNQFKKQQ